VRFDFSSLPKEYHKKYPFRKDEAIVFLGEIPNMPGHCVVSTKDGKVRFGYHTDNFIELKPEET